MQRLLSITLISIAADIVYTQEGDIKEHQGPQICGRRLKGPVGIIQTPNFPNPFPVPIKCRWIIEHDIVNGTISIYFTQQYTTSGLTFTEYLYYDEYKLGERKMLKVTEENITMNNWLQVQSPILVVELTLNRLDGTQLKALGLLSVQSPILVVELTLNRLDGTQFRALGLLSVFGFNMTYMVKGPTDEPGPKSCSTVECRLLGHCYAKHDYKEFYCDCFEGYSGADCGVGPLCPKTPNICKNGGTCGQMGPAAVSCICAPGFTGDLCEAQIEAPGNYRLGKYIPISRNQRTWRVGVEGWAPSCSSRWLGPPLRQSTPDTRTDIVRCVEYKDTLLSPQRYDANVSGPHLGDSHMGNAHVSTTHAVELGVLRTPPEPTKRYTGRQFDASKDSCSICAHSNPDVSKITSSPIKSCLKKPKPEFSSSISLPFIKFTGDEKNVK